MHDLINCLLALSVLVWISNGVYACRNVGNRLVFGVFHGMLFLFLLGRPLIEILWTDDWIQEEIQTFYFDEQGMVQAFSCIALSMVCLRLGACLGERLGNREMIPHGKALDSAELQVIRVWTLAVFAAAAVCEAVFEGEKVLFIRAHSYLEYYTTYVSQLPYGIYAGSTFMEYAACIYLATLPGRRGSWTVCGIMALTALPMFLMGNRAVLMLKLVFLFVYLVFRETLSHNGKWFGKWHCLVLAAALPGMMVLMNLINYTRADSVMTAVGIVDILLDFVRKQGVTFSWLYAGCTIIDQLRALCPVSYTFSPFLEYIGSGMIASKLFGAAPLPADLVRRALASHTLGDKLSYLVLGEAKYMAGHGTGTTYLLEVFSDFGFAGVGIFSLLLGTAMTAAWIWARKRFSARIGMLCAAQTLFFMPRSSAIDCFSFLWRAPFWLLIASLAAVVWAYRIVCKRRM